MLIMKQVIGSAVLFSLRESVTDPACFDPGSGFNTNYQFTGSCFLSVSERRLGKKLEKGVKMKTVRVVACAIRVAFDLQFLRQENHLEISRSNHATW